MSAYDVVIVGAGPSGMQAAVELRGQGHSVLVADEQPAPGGQIWRGVERNVETRLAGALGLDYARGAELARAFRACGVDYRPETQVWQIEEGWTVFLNHAGRAEMVRAKAVLLATGAQERPVPFPGWTLPGVMTVGAAQILLKSGGFLPQGPVWLCGAGPLPLLYAHQILALGWRIDGIIDTSLPSRRLQALRHLPRALRDWRSLAKGARWMAELRRSGIRILRGVTDLQAEGEERLSHLNFSNGGQNEQVEASLLLTHEGVIPSVHATMALGCTHDWHAEQRYMAPRLDSWGETSRSGLFVAGDGAGIGGVDAAVARGGLAALGIARKLGGTSDARSRKAYDVALARALSTRPLLDALYPAPTHRLPDDLVVCRCEEVTAGRVREAARAGAPDPNQVKAATRAGMGPCQGRQCGYTVSRLIAEEHSLAEGHAGFFNIRPPLKPVTLGALAALEIPEDAE
ncbi:FAD-dependent oxidoreductase [Vannielia litorea]|uniref:NAD(P)/FAD-dependent oxidoreductase n=1 Tax=Vannielia litorea TaxID=1217970 RepID=UPI001C987249|nr:NAD(P)/FAD-dependent oxidoreductase [Vannielia litorea]MBY6153790.1 FAD-dependent oxidoreductase [Vannielia litorea]